MNLYGMAMFKKVFVEKEFKNHSRVQSILGQIKYSELIHIESIENVWGRVKKPYLQKRTTLNLFLGAKKGQLVKEAPPAYGLGIDKHFYFIHAYNCIYECEYCYLQGHFNTPDLVFFINHEEILNKMDSVSREHPGCWFHAGEFSDSLALSHITGELPLYFDFFKNHPKEKLEIRTKSVNIKELLTLPPLPNVYISFSLSSEYSAKNFDLKCPTTKHRLNAIKKLVEAGFMIGIHFDPIIYVNDFEKDYKELIDKLATVLPDNQLAYISIGVVRFTADVYHQTIHNYPESEISHTIFSKSEDGMVRYNRPMRKWVLNTVREMLLPYYQNEKIYECMED